MIHDRKYFYKYVTAETALKILQSRTFKYSSPIKFNDPFDTQTRMHFGFNNRDLIKALNDELYKLIHDKEEPNGNESNSFFRGIKKAWYLVQQSSKKMPRNILQQLTKQFDEETIELADQYVEEMNIFWEEMSKSSKIFCVAEEHTNLLMWAHYAKEHTGAVIKLKCLPELDTPLCAAKKVEYSDKPPVIAEIDEYIKYITGQSPAPENYNSIFYKMFLTKSDHWKYEQEWRVFIPPYNMKNSTIQTDEYGKEILSDFLPFHPQEIHSIYLGCKITTQNRHNILKCLKDDLGHVKKYKCSRNEKKYRIDFEEIV